MEIDEQATSPVDTGKPPRFRSVSYPSNTISHCVDLTARITKIFGTHTYTSREFLAKELNISDGHLQSQLSSCVQYGLLELKKGDGYKPTALFTKIHKPLPTENPAEAKKESFGFPELYKVIINQYNGSTLPMQGGLATVLYRNHKLAELASEIAAKIFIENAKELGVLNEEFSFSLTAQDGPELLDFVEIQDKPKDERPKEETIIHLPPPKVNPTNRGDSEIRLPVLLDGGFLAEVVLPNGYDKNDLERIVKVINAYI